MMVIDFINRMSFHLETGKGLKKMLETVLKTSKVFQAFFLPLSQTRAKIKQKSARNHERSRKQFQAQPKSMKLLRKNNEKQAEIQKQQTQRGGAKRRPFGAAPKAPPCCLPFGKDFLCFWCISGPCWTSTGPAGILILNFRVFLGVPFNGDHEHNQLHDRPQHKLG